MAKKYFKQATIKVRKTFATILWILLLIILFCFLVKIDAVAAFVANLFGLTVEEVRAVTNAVLPVALGAVVIHVGMALASATAFASLGLAVAVAGLALVVYSLWPFLKNSLARLRG